MSAFVVSPLARLLPVPLSGAHALASRSVCAPRRRTVLPVCPSSSISMSAAQPTTTTVTEKDNDNDDDTILSNAGYNPGDRVLLFDGVCVLCNAGVDFVLRYDGDAAFKFAALQSDVGMRLLERYGAPNDLSTVVLLEGDRAYTKSDAVLRAGRALGFPFAPPAQLALLAIPAPLRDALYTYGLAKNRYALFGQKDECTLMRPEHRDRFLL